MNLTTAQRRNVAAHMTHVLIAGRMPSSAGTLDRFLDLIESVDNACPEAVEQWVDTLPESTFPDSPFSTTLLTPSTNLKPERN